MELTWIIFSVVLSMLFLVAVIVILVVFVLVTHYVLTCFHFFEFLFVETIIILEVVSFCNRKKQLCTDFQKLTLAKLQRIYIKIGSVFI